MTSLKVCYTAIMVANTDCSLTGLELCCTAFAAQHLLYSMCCTALPGLFKIDHAAQMCSHARLGLQKQNTVQPQSLIWLFQ